MSRFNYYELNNLTLSYTLTENATYFISKCIDVFSHNTLVHIYFLKGRFAHFPNANGVVNALVRKLLKVGIYGLVMTIGKK